MAIDNQKAIATLTSLHGQIDPLISKSKMDADFFVWHCGVLNDLEEIFGPDSEKVKDFQQIFLDLSPEIINRVRERFQVSLKDIVNTEVLKDFSIPLDNYYRQKLYGAKEFLLSVIVKLKKK